MERCPHASAGRSGSENPGHQFFSVRLARIVPAPYLYGELNPKEAIMAETTLSVPNISCGHCVKAIESELADVSGVSSVKADADSKTVTVVWDAPATLANIRATLTEINYPAAS